MLIHGINDNIRIPHLSYLGVYQYEFNMRALQKDKYLFWVGTKPQKTDKTVVHISTSALGILKKIPTAFLNGRWV